MDISVKIATKIKSICKERNKKISVLMRETKLSSHLIDDWQKGKVNPSIVALTKICDNLNIQICELFKTDKDNLTLSQNNILNQWRMLADNEKQAILLYIEAMKSNHSKA